MATPTRLNPFSRSPVRQTRSLLGIGLLSVLTGCSRSAPTSNCVPAAGIVLVDSVPAEGVMISLHPPGGGPSISHGVSQENGAFVISTYARGDGAEPGSYVVTCKWGAYDALTRSYREDRLNGKYASVKDSQISWTLSAEDPSAFKKIELVTGKK